MTKLPVIKNHTRESIILKDGTELKTYTEVASLTEEQLESEDLFNLYFHDMISLISLSQMIYDLKAIGGISPPKT